MGAIMDVPVDSSVGSLRIGSPCESAPGADDDVT